MLRSGDRTARGPAAAPVPAAFDRILLGVVPESRVALPSDPVLLPGSRKFGAEPLLSPAFLGSALRAGEAPFSGTAAGVADPPCAEARVNSAARRVAAAMGLMIFSVLISFLR